MNIKQCAIAFFALFLLIGCCDGNRNSFTIEEEPFLWHTNVGSTSQLVGNTGDTVIIEVTHQQTYYEQESCKVCACDVNDTYEVHEMDWILRDIEGASGGIYLSVDKDNEVYTNIEIGMQSDNIHFNYRLKHHRQERSYEALSGLGNPLDNVIVNHLYTYTFNVTTVHDAIQIVEYSLAGFLQREIIFHPTWGILEYRDIPTGLIYTASL